MICNDDGDIIMGNGRMRILCSIEKTGSINQTAKELKMAYKTVWSKIRSTEENLGQAVIIADKVKGTKLTAKGKELLEKFQQLKKRCLKADDVVFDQIFK